MRVIAAAAVLALAACAGPTTGDDFGAVADVSGRVLLASGAPLTSGSVTVSCAAGMVEKVSPLGDVGQYAVALSIATSALGGSGGHAACRFSASDGTRVVATRDAEIGFGPPGLPHVMQLV